MRDAFYKLEAFLELYLNKDGIFTIDIVHLINLISSHIPELKWNVYVWEVILRENSSLSNVILLIENDQFREIKFKGTDLIELGFIINSVKIFSSISTKRDLFRNYFYKGCKNGKIDIVKYLHSIGYNSQSDYFVLRLVVRQGHLEILKYLCIEYDFTVDRENLFREAVEFGLLEIIKYLYSKGCNPTSQNNWAITTASYLGHLEVVKYLYSIGCDPTDRENCSIRAASSNNHLEVVKYLYEKCNCDPKSVSNQAIREASSNGHLEVVKYLYYIGCNPKVLNNYAIKWASMHGHLEVVKYLYEVAGCDLKTDDNLSIIWASCNGHLEVVKYLYEVAGCDPTAHNNWAIRLASKYGHLEVTDYLYSIGCGSLSHRLTRRVTEICYFTVKYFDKMREEIIEDFNLNY